MSKNINTTFEKTQGIQKRIYDNKIAKGFNVTDINKEFCFLYGEVAEAYNAWKNRENVSEELADIAIYLLGLSEILGIDLGEAINDKIAINEQRIYKSIDGVNKRVENTHASTEIRDYFMDGMK